MKKGNISSGGTVYSTEHGRMCPDCGRPAVDCLCRRQKTALPKSDGMTRVSLETKGRKGKGVTLITGLPMAEEGLSELAKRLKQRCSSGGTVKDGVRDPGRPSTDSGRGLGKRGLSGQANRRVVKRLPLVVRFATGVPYNNLTEGETPWP